MVLLGVMDVAWGSLLCYLLVFSLYWITWPLVGCIECMLLCSLLAFALLVLEYSFCCCLWAMMFLWGDLLKVIGHTLRFILVLSFYICCLSITYFEAKLNPVVLLKCPVLHFISYSYPHVMCLYVPLPPNLLLSYLCVFHPLIWRSLVFLFLSSLVWISYLSSSFYWNEFPLYMEICGLLDHWYVTVNVCFFFTHLCLTCFSVLLLLLPVIFHIVVGYISRNSGVEIYWRLLVILCAPSLSCLSFYVICPFPYCCSVHDVRIF